MPVEVNPEETSRASAYELWLRAPNPMVTFFKTVDVTNLDCVPGTRAELEVSPMFVPPQINRQYE